MCTGEPTKKEQPCCPYCGSNDVSIDAVAKWDNDKQDWEMVGTFDSGSCSSCEKETKYFHWKEI